MTGGKISFVAASKVDGGFQGSELAALEGLGPDKEQIGRCCKANVAYAASRDNGTSELISHTHSRSSSDPDTHH